MPHSVSLPPKMAVHSSGACRLCVLFLLLSAATLSAAAVSTPDSPLCPMPSPPPQQLAAGEDALALLPSLELNAGYFFGGEGIHFTKDKDDTNASFYSYVTRSFSLHPLDVVGTTDSTLLHVNAALILSGGRARQYSVAHRRRRRRFVGRHSVTFHFHGYYSLSTAELCMTGSGYYSEEDGSIKRLRNVDLHLRIPNPSSISHPFVTGIVKGAGIDKISLVAYAVGDAYQYGKSASCSPPQLSSTARGAMQALGANFSCAHLKEHLATSYKLEYAGGAHASGSSPLTMGLQARRMHMGQVQCTADGSVRAYAAFSNDTMEEVWGARMQRPPFMFEDEVVVAEGRWNSTAGVLCLSACRVLRSGSETSLSTGDCSIGMRFWFPGVWTIRDRSAVVGMLWNSSQAAGGGANDVSGVVSASSIDFNIHRSNFSDVKYSYNYTMVEEAKKHYLNDHKKKVQGSFMAPNYTYHDFAFNFYTTSRDIIASGDAYPITIGSTIVYGDQLAAEDSFSQNAVLDVKEHELLNISYDIRRADWVRPKNGSYVIPLEERKMTAEGVFDPETGIMCMIACQEVNSSTDCQILVTVQFASLLGKSLGQGRGSISSLRNKETDPFFFEKIDIRLRGMYSEQVFHSISRMDLEGILLLISTTLPCVFTILQVLHAKRRPEAAAATSITMLVVLALGYVAPLVVSSEALFMSWRWRYVPRPFQSYVPYELSQAMMRAPTLIALLLQLHLVQLAWSARKTDADRSKAEAAAASSSSAAERRALWLCVPLYLIGGALTILAHVVSVRGAAREDSLTLRIGAEPATVWEDLVSSAGLALDAFLLPQVVMNALSAGAGVRALSPWFYVGGTVVRAMPHVYDVIRAQGYVPSLNPSYVYASPRYDRFGIAWDVAVPGGAALLAVLLFLQQRVGLFRSRRRLGEYEMVSPR